MNITGDNFTAQAFSLVVDLFGSGKTLPTIVINDENLQVVIPSDLALGQLGVIVRDNQTTPLTPPANAGNITIVDPIPTAEPPTFAPPPTQAPPPTDVPGAPNLLVRTYSANPGTIRPGERVTFTVELFNQGTRVAQGVSLSVDAGQKFLPADGQATIILPDIGVGGSFAVNFTVIAANDVAAGPQNVNITMNFRDFTGTAGSSKQAVVVNVDALARASQIVLARYLVNPNPVIPGEPVTISVLLQNTGNERAGQVLIQIADGILLAGPQGNTFAAGDIEPGASASIDLPLVVNSTAKAGPQSQALNISFLQGTESKTANQTITLEVANVVAPAPLLLLESYSIGEDKTFLRPGETFTLTMNLKNIGQEDANDLRVTFGAVDTTPDNGTPGPSNPPASGSTTFAPLGTGSTIFAGNLERVEGAVTLTQEFIVNGTVDSGVYTLPIGLRYRTSDGTSGADNLGASIVVIIEPQVNISASAPVPETLNLGESLALSLELSNRGRKAVNFTTVTAEVTNGDVVEGQGAFIGPIQNNDNQTVDLNIIPLDLGPMTVRLVFNYSDDLNRPDQLVEEYEIEIVEAPPPIDFGEPPPGFEPGIPGGEPVPEDPNAALGRFLLGLLGLGS
jgi:uncharacterized repeat protein (TIGR01451 family)